MVPATLRRLRTGWRPGVCVVAGVGRASDAAAVGAATVGAKVPNGAATEGAVTVAAGAAGTTGTAGATGAANASAASRAARRELYCTWSAAAEVDAGSGMRGVTTGGTEVESPVRSDRRDGSSTFPEVRSATSGRRAEA